MKQLAATVFALMLGAGAAYAGDAGVGGQLAQRWCTQCHAIGNLGHGQDAAPPLPPPPEHRSSDWLHAWLTNPHPPMPNLSLTRQEIDDLTAYLQSLK